jgi:hypothetical protein
MISSLLISKDQKTKMIYKENLLKDPMTNRDQLSINKTLLIKLTHKNSPGGMETLI